MPADTQAWAELKEFEQCDPSALAFRAMVALLDTWPGDDQAAAIDYADKALGKWPDGTRVAPWSWCKAASKGAVLPTWPLVRSLQFGSGHLSKGRVNLARLAHHANLQHITELAVPSFSDFQELSFLYHRPETFPALKKLGATDKYKDGDVRALTDSPLWRTLETFEIEDLSESLAHDKDASRIVPHLDGSSRIQHLTLRSPDLIAVWDNGKVPHLQSASVFIRSVGEARALAAREELSQLSGLSIAFRCGFSGSSPFEPFLGNIIEADEAAADAFFGDARLDRLETLIIEGYSMGYWGREGLGRLGLDALISSGLLKRLKYLRLELLPLGDDGVAALAPALGQQLESLELVDVYTKGDGAAALIKSPCMSSVRHLDLSGNRIDAQHVCVMAQVDMPHLETLDLSGPGINPYYWNVGQQPILDAGAVAWANSGNARTLKQLRLANCHLTDEALKAIFRSPQLRNLAHLDVSHNSFTGSAIADAVVGSPLWQTLKELAFSNCRLDNAAIEALTHVKHAPALRSLELGYNSIGPKGAAALAAWPVLTRVWHLGLHDNVIGDEGLIALAKSSHLGRLLELDLEQDCWNSRAFTFNEDAAKAMAASSGFPRLDGLYSGCVDEYHGAAYSPGFTKTGLDAVRRSPHLRPACKAALSDFSRIHDYHERPAFNEDQELGDSDFRRYPMALNEKEAETKQHSMHQIRAQSADPTFDFSIPPEISPTLPEIDFDDDDIVEGLEFCDPTPVTDTQLRLSLSLEDADRPLPGQAGWLISKTLGSIFNAAGIGYFEANSWGSREEDGRNIDTSVGFSVGVKGDPEAALQLIREVLWWVGAPEDTTFRESALALSKEPARSASSFLQLATPTIRRWESIGETMHAINRSPFTTAQREGIQTILADVGATATADGWVAVETSDGGRMRFHTKYLRDADDYDTLNILVDTLTPQVSALAHRLMKECSFMLFPMSFAASTDVAGVIDVDWPSVEVVPSAATLHELLARGPYVWWRRT